MTTIEIKPGFEMPEEPEPSKAVEVLKTAAPIIKEGLESPTKIDRTEDTQTEPDSPDKEKEDAA